MWHSPRRCSLGTPTRAVLWVTLWRCREHSWVHGTYSQNDSWEWKSRFPQDASVCCSPGIKHRSTEHNSSLMVSESEFDSDRDTIFSWERMERGDPKGSMNGSVRNGASFSYGSEDRWRSGCKPEGPAQERCNPGPVSGSSNTELTLVRIVHQCPFTLGWMCAPKFKRLVFLGCLRHETKQKHCSFNKDAC